MGTSEAVLPDPLINLDASGLTAGPDLASWLNTGTLGGSFDKFNLGLENEGTGPSVTTVNGKKAVQFVQPTQDDAGRRTLAWTLTAPAGMTGASDWTVSTRLYRPSNTTNCYFSWSGQFNGAGAAAALYYRDNWAYEHNANGAGFATVPPIGQWHDVTITYDGTDEVIYVDGVLDSSTTRSLNIAADKLVILGSNTDVDQHWNDQYWRFNGSIASLKVFDEALDAAQVAELTASTSYDITVTTGANGTISPGPGVVSIDEGDSPEFIMIPDLGYGVGDVIVDGGSVGAVGSYTFPNVTGPHSISATFAEVPSQLVSGTVTDGTDPVEGATLYFSLGAPAIASPLFTATTDANGDYSVSLPPAGWHSMVILEGYDFSADSTFSVTNAAVTLPDVELTANPDWDVLFVTKVDQFAGYSNGDPTGEWTPAAILGNPPGATFSPIATPTITQVGGVNWIQIDRDDAIGNDGFELIGAPFTVQPNAGVDAIGVSAVVVVQPIYTTVGGEARGEVVNLYYNGLSLCVDHGTGEVMIARKAWDWQRTGTIIPEGQKTILSLVCQIDGSAKLYVNGVQSDWPGSSLGAGYYADLTGGDGRKSWQNRIAIGRNAWDGWSSFNGNIGDVYVYRRALPDADREALEASLTAKFLYNPDDSDSDGLSDIWELSFPGIPDLTHLNGTASGPGPGIGTGDYDGDGTSDLAEQRLGLIPNVATSNFAAAIVRNGDGTVTLTWPSQMDLEFDVLWTEDLSEPAENWFKVNDSGPVVDTAGTGSLDFTDTIAALEPLGYYQVVLLP